jgi:hypothetical protein
LFVEAVAKNYIPAPRILLGAGAVLVLAAIAIDTIPFTISASGISQSNTVPQWNDLCTGGIGQFAQDLYQNAHTDCGYVSTADHAIGWLLGVGIAALVVGLIGLVTRSRDAQHG